MPLILSRLKKLAGRRFKARIMEFFKNVIIYWSIVTYVSPILFFLASKFFPVNREKISVFRNYFTYFILYHTAQILIMRIGYKTVYFEKFEWNNLILIALPILVLLSYFLKKQLFFLLYSVFSLGTIVIYTFNIFQPGMSLKMNLYVIIEYALCWLTYLFYLKYKFSFKFFKSAWSIKTPTVVTWAE